MESIRSRGASPGSDWATNLGGDFQEGDSSAEESNWLWGPHHTCVYGIRNKAISPQQRGPSTEQMYSYEKKNNA